MSERNEPELAPDPRHTVAPDTRLTPATQGQASPLTPEGQDKDSKVAIAKREWQESEADNRGQSDN